MSVHNSRALSSIEFLNKVQNSSYWPYVSKLTISHPWFFLKGKIFNVILYLFLKIKSFQMKTGDASDLHISLTSEYHGILRFTYIVHTLNMQPVNVSGKCGIFEVTHEKSSQFVYRKQ